ncbi:hypothetical protein SGCOL_006505 [Colletotrichum sp. CLE4]
MRARSVLLALAGILLSPTTADPIAIVMMPTESATLPLDRLKNSGPLDQRSEISTPRQVISESTGKETCGYFRTGGELALVTCTAGTGTSRIACHNTGRWLCGSLYSTCLGPAEPICSGKTENGERTLCWPSLLRLRLQDKIHPEPRGEYVAYLCHRSASTVIINIIVFDYVQAPDRICDCDRGAVCYPDGYALGVFVV